MSGKSLRELLEGIATIADGDIVAHGLTLDSRRVRSGAAFIALQGASTHGITFAPAVLAQGASVILAEGPAPAVSADDKIVWIDGLRDQVGEIAARFFERPSSALHVIGVTGTNGKTSIVQCSPPRWKTCARGAIGTLGAGLVGAIRASAPHRTRQRASTKQFRDAGATRRWKCLRMRWSRRGTHRFEVAVFTNLTRDRWTIGTMDNYGAAKPAVRMAHLRGVINADDTFGRS